MSLIVSFKKVEALDIGGLLEEKQLAEKHRAALQELQTYHETERKNGHVGTHISIQGPKKPMGLRVKRELVEEILSYRIIVVDQHITDLEQAIKKART